MTKKTKKTKPVKPKPIQTAGGGNGQGPVKV